MKQLAERFGYRIARIPKGEQAFGEAELPFLDLLELIVQDYCRNLQRDFFFVQIGAHDGISADPIAAAVRKHRWKGLLVEPQHEAFASLRHNYRDHSQLIFEQAAVTARDGHVTLYAVGTDQLELPYWLRQTASFDRAMVLRALNFWRDKRGLSEIPRDPDSLVVEHRVPALTFSSLMAKHQIEHVDLLVIDTMGHDFEILKALPWQRFKPAIIHFEHSLLSMADRRIAMELLAAQGYHLAKVAVDTIAYLGSANESGARTWIVADW